MEWERDGEARRAGASVSVCTRGRIQEMETAKLRSAVVGDVFVGVLGDGVSASRRAGVFALGGV